MAEIRNPVFLMIIANECEKKETLPDICKIALLKYYAGRKYPDELEEVLHRELRRLTEKQIDLSVLYEVPGAVADRASAV